MIEAARQIPASTRMDKLGYVNHGGMAVVSRPGLAVAIVTTALKIHTFEDLCVCD